MKFSVTFLVFIFCSTVISQNTTEVLPFHEIPEYPEYFTAATVAARQIEALGFRFYWATEGLTADDFSFKPNDASASTGQTMVHIYNLSEVILSATLHHTVAKKDVSQLSNEAIRAEALTNLKQAADILRKADDLSQFNIDFENGRTAPFWNAINGPIADSIWHCGQIASFRRSSGNPINPKIDHFTGTIKN